MLFIDLIQVETLKGDSIPLLDKLGVSELPSRNVYDLLAGDDKRKANLLETYIKLSSSVKKKLHKRYYWDFVLYGYGWDDSVGSTCTIQGINGVCC